MLKNKVRFLEKEMNNIVKQKEGGVFFVDVEDGEYIIKQSPGNCEVFRGNKDDYEKFVEKNDNDDSLYVTVFIIDDIPRTGEPIRVAEKN